MKFLGITFDSKFTFQKHFEEVLARCNTRYHRIRLLVNKKWGPSPSTILQIYKQCVQPVFEYGPLSTMTTSDTIIAHGQNLPVQILIRGKRVRGASSDSQCSVYFSRVLNSLSTGIQAQRLRYFRFSDLQKCFLDLFIMLNKIDYVAVNES